MTSSGPDTDDFEQRFARQLRDLGERAPLPSDDLRPVHRRVAVRARRRNATRGAAMAVVAAVGLGGFYLRASHPSHHIDASRVSSVSSASSPTVASVSPSPTSAPAADAPDPVGWTTAAGVTAPGWQLVGATSWNDVRSADASRFTVFQRTSTWRAGERDASGQFLIVQSEVADSPFTPGAATAATDKTVTAGARQLLIKTLGDGLVRGYWSETVKDSTPWTMSITALNTDEATLVAAVSDARWNETSELWELTGLPSRWQRDRWPNSGQPREIELRYRRDVDGVQLDVLATAAAGRFGAALAAERSAGIASGSATAVTVRGTSGFAARDSATGAWRIVWAEGTQLSYEAVGGAGLPLVDVVALLGDVSLASVPTVKGS